MQHMFEIEMIRTLSNMPRFIICNTVYHEYAEVTDFHVPAVAAVSSV